MTILKGDSLDLILAHTAPLDLVVTDAPYAFGGEGAEHALSATVAIVLREVAERLAPDRWMLTYCASSWRSTMYMVESVRGILRPVRVAQWHKPKARSKARTAGWAWATVNVVAFSKGSPKGAPSDLLDYIVHAPVVNGRRAQLPAQVAHWSVAPFAVPGGLFLDPFAGSGALVEAAQKCGMTAIGFEQNPPNFVAEQLALDVEVAV